MGKRVTRCLAAAGTHRHVIAYGLGGGCTRWVRTGRGEVPLLCVNKGMILSENGGLDVHGAGVIAIAVAAAGRGTYTAEDTPSNVLLLNLVTTPLHVGFHTGILALIPQPIPTTGPYPQLQAVCPSQVYPQIKCKDGSEG